MDEDNFRLKVYTILKEQGLLDSDKVMFDIPNDDENLRRILSSVEIQAIEESLPIN